MEMTRFDLLSIYEQVHGRMKAVEYPQLTSDKKRRFVVMLRQLSCGSPMNAEKEQSARDILRETRACMTGLGLTEPERVQIVQAMGMRAGHWFKCPNGMRLFICYAVVKLLSKRWWIPIGARPEGPKLSRTKGRQQKWGADCRLGVFEHSRHSVWLLCSGVFRRGALGDAPPFGLNTKFF